jgi:aryl-alcohol dehydrogenase-like predicted oxidoreductase
MRRRSEVVDVLHHARTAGKTRQFGYSRDSEAACYATTCGVFDTLQTSVHLADQEAIDLTLPQTHARGLGVIAKRPLANVAGRPAAPARRGTPHRTWESPGAPAC